MRLPLAPAQPSAARDAAAQPTAALRAATPRRVLIVDDNEDGAEMLEPRSAQLGHIDAHGARRPRARSHGRGAFAPEVALLDIGLPVMDGYELARAASRVARRAARRCWSRSPATATTSDRADARAAGFDRHLVKPARLRGAGALIESLPK